MSATIAETIETVIRRPPEEVAAYTMDPANDPSWIGGLREIRRLDEGPLGLGSRVERVSRMLGRDIHYVNEIVAYEPPTKLAMHAVKSPFPMDVTYTFLPHTDGTTARIDVSGEPGGFFGLARPLLRRMVVRNIGRDLRRLKEQLER